MTRFGSRYVLNIRNVMEEDYGNYTCKAQNNLGTASTYIILTGVPTEPEIMSGTVSSYKDQYKLTWKVTSYFRVVDHRVDVRMRMEKSVGLNKTSQWFTYSHLTVNHFSGDSVFYESFTLDNLQPNTNYETRVWTRNSHGWSKPSRLFHFSTARIDSQPKERAS